MAAVKSYGQWCSLAKALDVVGERWSLLVVRELFDGPKRYTDLRDGIPGISTDVLAARLTSLEEDGVVTRATTPSSSRLARRAARTSVEMPGIPSRRSV
jgi:DNA-binding HxlR family transcriptional regulator